MWNLSFFGAIFVLFHTIKSIDCQNALPPTRGVVDQFNKDAFRMVTDETTYKKHEPPPSGDGPLRIHISIMLSDFGALNQLENEFSLHLLLRISWMDERLRAWNSTLFPGHNMAVLEGGSSHLERLWTPALHIPNSKTPNILQDESLETVLARIQSDGHILVSKRIILNGVSDQLDYSLYPLGVQTVHFEVESNQFTSDNMEILWLDSVPFDRDDDFHWNGYDMVRHELHEVHTNYSYTGTFSKVVAIFYLKGHFQQFLLDFYVPIYLCVIMSWGSFWINITEAPARVSFSMTVLLTLVTSARYARAKLPAIESVNALDLWILMCIFFVFANLMEYTAVNYIFHAEKRAQLKRNKRRKSALAKVLGRRRHALKGISTAASLQTNKKPKDGFDELMPPDALKNASTSKCKRILVSYYSFSSCFGRKATYVINHGDETLPRSHQHNQRKKGEGCEEIAIEIDRISRMAFPSTFALFNVLYWTIMIVKSNSLEIY